MAKKGQIASSDIVIALVVFVVAAAVFASFFLGSNSIGGASKLDDDSDILLNDLISADAGNPDDAAVASSGKVDQTRLTHLIKKMVDADDNEDTYQELKSELGIDGDYCIHFEDEEGNVIYLHELIGASATPNKIDADSIEGTDDIYVYGIGSPNINISNRSCYTYSDYNGWT